MLKSLSSDYPGKKVTGEQFILVDLHSAFVKQLEVLPE